MAQRVGNVRVSASINKLSDRLLASMSAGSSTVGCWPPSRANTQSGNDQIRIEHDEIIKFVKDGRKWAELMANSGQFCWVSVGNSVAAFVQGIFEATSEPIFMTLDSILPPLHVIDDELHEVLVVVVVVAVAVVVVAVVAVAVAVVVVAVAVAVAVDCLRRRFGWPSRLARRPITLQLRPPRGGALERDTNCGIRVNRSFLLEVVFSSAALATTMQHSIPEATPRRQFEI